MNIFVNILNNTVLATLGSVAVNLYLYKYISIHNKYIKSFRILMEGLDSVLYVEPCFSIVFRASGTNQCNNEMDH